LPAKRKFFLDKARGRIAFSARLSQLLDNLIYPNFYIIQTSCVDGFKTAA
jgi:hypothetical protein